MSAQNAELENLRANNITRFELKPKDIIEQFTKIKSFSGDDVEYTWRVFKDVVNGVLLLCGQENAELKTYCLSQVCTTKIVGKAGSILLEMEGGPRTWEDIVAFLDRKFRPKGRLVDLIREARNVKANNVKELMARILRIKIQASEIYRYNNNVAGIAGFDNEMVDIVKSKLKPYFQMHIHTEHTLEDVDRLFSNFESYESFDAIKNEDRDTRTNLTNNLNIQNNQNNNVRNNVQGNRLNTFHQKPYNNN